VNIAARVLLGDAVFGNRPETDVGDDHEPKATQPFEHIVILL